MKQTKLDPPLKKKHLLFKLFEIQNVVAQTYDVLLEANIGDWKSVDRYWIDIDW